MSSEVKRCWNFCFSSWESLEATSTIASITVFRMSLDALQSRTVDATRDRGGKGVLRKGKAKEGGKRMQKSITRAQDSTRGRLTSGVAPVLDELDALASDEQLGGDGLGAVVLDPLNARRGWCEKHRLAVHQTGQEAKQRVGGCVLAKAARVVRVGDGKQDLGDLAVTACLVFHRVQNRRSTGGHA